LSLAYALCEIPFRAAIVEVKKSDKCAIFCDIAGGTSLVVAVTAMRKRYRVLILAALAAALIVPVGFALELPMPTSTASVAVSSVFFPSVPDPLKLFTVGTLLIALAAFVRRSA
jgi:hypothetical protein